MGWIIGIITTILGIAAGFGGGVLYRKRVAERAIGSPSIQSHKRRDSQQFRIAQHPAAASLLFSPHGKRSRPLLFPGAQAAQSNTRR